MATGRSCGWCGVAEAVRTAAYRLALWLTGGLSAAILLFLLAAWIGSSIPRNRAWVEPEDGVTIMVESNGFHTGIVLPVVTAQKDWRADFPFLRDPLPGGDLPTHIDVGWGEREVFLNVPSWSDLKAQTVLRIVTEGGPGLLRVVPFARPAPGEDWRPLRLRPAEYARLVRRIEAALPPVAPGAGRVAYTSYQANARNFDATGRYTLGNTCNQWVGDTLAAAGVEMGRWTPFAGGVMKWITRPAERSGEWRARTNRALAR
ncbi:DUF2459 domain-containing protein [Erythrobacter sp. LQ02-29]|uniref:DUF2459 domain-containing protein n=1 Tax=Erythrobacter sp. LQ02-29 TaxID=2920384 RepID=UPI001F4E6AD3|nr:DUF2459 domain-containing protein [Erythrobacter sp. LQ02-29]MCP9223017.1 DUF2459 domain-containing protein [Erythrobacter sp. LQ02-29]